MTYTEKLNILTTQLKEMKLTDFQLIGLYRIANTNTEEGELAHSAAYKEIVHRNINVYAL